MRKRRQSFTSNSWASLKIGSTALEKTFLSTHKSQKAAAYFISPAITATAVPAAPCELRRREYRSSVMRSARKITSTLSLDVNELNGTLLRCRLKIRLVTG